MRIVSKRFFLVLLCALLVMPVLTACQESGPNRSTTTVIDIITEGKGIGSDWIKNAAARFTALKKDSSYAAGKTGVAFNIDTAQDITLNNSRSEGYMIYTVDRTGTVASEAARGYIVSIDDIVREKVTETRDGQPVSVEDKFVDGMNDYFMYGGEYYALPYLEFYGGLTYNRKIFDAKGFYFAKPGTSSSNVTAHSNPMYSFNTFNFVKPGTAESIRSCGPDGVYNTYDDGLPSSLVEFLILCDYMKNENGVEPFSFTGQHKYYTNHFQDAVIASLIGSDYKDLVFNSDSKGEKVRVVTGFANENLFATGGVGGIDYLQKPIIKEVVITEESGYYSSWMEEKYYTDALLSIIDTERFFHANGYSDSASHYSAQRTFLSGEAAMLIEASYWNYEANANDLYRLAGVTEADLDIRFMPLPVNIFESVTEGNGEAPTLQDASSSFTCISSRFADNEEIMSACKDFLRFLMTDSELSKWTACNGQFKPMNFEIQAEDEATITGYYKSLADARKSATVVYNHASNETYLQNRRGFYSRGWSDGQFQTGKFTSMLEAMRMESGWTAMRAFENQMVVKSGWSNIYKGAGTVAGYVDPGTGQEVTFNS